MEGFGAFTGKRLDVPHVAVRKGDRRVGNLLSNAADDGIGKAEVVLGVPWRVGERNVKSFCLLSQCGKGQTNGTITAHVALFVA